MMEPHATIAEWNGDELTCWCPTQILQFGVRDLAKMLEIPKGKVRLVTPFVGGGFGGKISVLSDTLAAALAARVTGRAVKVALTRRLMFNNTTHRPATIQRIRLGAKRDGTLTAIGHECWSGNLPASKRGEMATQSTRVLYAAPNRMTAQHLTALDLAEGNAMRAPGEASGMAALEIAMDELAEKLQLDPVELRIRNDTQVDPENPERPFSKRQLVRCLKMGAEQFGWRERKAKPASVRDGRWLVGMGVASAIRGAPIKESAARVILDGRGFVTVETDMTDIGTGTYTIIAQTAAEMMGLPLDRVVVKLGDSHFPESAGSGGQFGAASATAGVYAACVKLQAAIAQKLGLRADGIAFKGGDVIADGRRASLASAAADGPVTGEDGMTYGDLSKHYVQQTFGAHFVEVAVDSATGETRIRRMLAVCAAGRILNPLAARSQVIGGMTMGAGAALMEELVVDKRVGFFVNHDLAGYEVPVHADIPHQDVVFVDEVDATMSPLKAKGVGELGIVGVAAAIANAIYNATGVRVRDYPITLDKLLVGLPDLPA